MPQSDFSAGTDGETIRQIATELEATSLDEVAEAVQQCAGGSISSRCDSREAAVAALIVASRRCPGPALSLHDATERVGADPDAVRHAVECFEGALTPPAPVAERRRLRQTVVALDELLAAMEAGRSNPPRLAGPALEHADPSVLAYASQPLECLDADALRRDRRRFAADLTLARLGVELFARVRTAADSDQ